MYLNLSFVTWKWIQEAVKYFPQEFIYNLKTHPFCEESLCAKYYVSQYVWNNFLPQISETWLPEITNNNYWSISHKKWVFFVGVSNQKIGLDIELLQEKSIELLEYFPKQLYRKLWWKSWENFYFLWTAIEALYKFEQFQDEIILEEIYCESVEWIFALQSEIIFSKRIVLQFKSKKYQIFSGISQNRLYSVCSFENLTYETL